MVVKTKCPVTAYAEAAIGGEIVVSKWVRLACERHIQDLETGSERGLHFDTEAAQRIIQFFSLLKHYKGEWAGQPLVLEPWQEFILGCLFGWMREDGTRRFKTAYAEIARKNGKSFIAAGVGLYLTFFDNEAGAEVFSAAPLALDTLIPTPSGWTTMDKVKVGDKVFDDNGNPCNVTYVAPVLYDRACYRMTFSDGAQVVADGEHRWETEVFCSGRSLKGRKKREFFRTRSGSRTKAIYTTREIKGSLYYECRGRHSKNHCIAVARPLQCADALLPIGPYTLGVWLGDGRNNRGAIVIHPNDKAIAEHIQAEGYKINEHGHDSLLRFTILDIRGKLSAFGLLDNKHIPPIYLRASQSQRMELLRGLMDTDGTCTKEGECRFTNGCLSLIDGVYQLITSLGIKCNRRQTVSASGKPHWLLSFKIETPVFHLSRKRERQVAMRDLRTRRRYIESVEEEASVPVRCIAVDSPSHLFLVSEAMIPTHNTKRDQAKIVWNDARQIVLRSPSFKRHIKVNAGNLHNLKSASKFEPLGADHDTADGLNIHGCIIDELHAHKTRHMWDVLETATSSRRQPLTFVITTAGFDRHSICWEQHHYATQILEGAIEDDSYFAYIACLDEGDAWDDESVWIKANPNLHVSVKIEDLRRKCERAKSMPSAQNAFRRLHLDEWTEQLKRWLAMEVWDKGKAPIDIDALEGRSCYAGLDLAKVHDLSALILVFPPGEDEEDYQTLSYFWCPEEDIQTRADRDRVPYPQWVREGLIETTEGNSTDYDFLEQEIIELAQKYDILELVYDRFLAHQMISHLQNEDITVVPFGQGFASMGPATAEMERLMLAGKIRHGGHPILRWNASNVTVRTDPAGNIKPDKQKSTERIDGIVALIMAVGRAMVNAGDDTSVYEERGLLVL